MGQNEQWTKNKTWMSCREANNEITAVSLLKTSKTRFKMFHLCVVAMMLLVFSNAMHAWLSLAWIGGTFSKLNQHSLWWGPVTSVCSAEVNCLAWKTICSCSVQHGHLWGPTAVKFKVQAYEQQRFQSWQRTHYEQAVCETKKSNKNKCVWRGSHDACLQPCKHGGRWVSVRSKAPVGKFPKQARSQEERNGGPTQVACKHLWSVK